MAIPTRQPRMFFFVCFLCLFVCLFVGLFVCLGCPLNQGKQLQKLFSVFFFINSFFQWLVESSLVPRPTPFLFFGLRSVWRRQRVKNCLCVLYWTQTKEQKNRAARPGNKAKSRGLRKVPRLMNAEKNLHRKKFYKAAKYELTTTLSICY